eukprot:maker-scaffold1742_size29367-snap-gene-0.3 protein:Tk10773 transcript:maker-scaffold1742_size29367-snap-gene-0.3-mRNA-1 annotation:"tripsin "
MAQFAICLLMISVLAGSLQALQHANCGFYRLNAGDAFLITNTDDDGKFWRKCDYSFYKDPMVSDNMILTCSQFELDSQGCKKSKMIVSGFGFPRQRVCQTQENLRLETNGSFWRIEFKSQWNAANGNVFCILSVGPGATMVPPSTEVPTTDPVATATPGPTNGCQCGRPKRQTRIVGGQATEVNEYPWQVMLNYTQDNKFFCGGSLISEDWVLTAAHCLVGVILGEHDFRDITEAQIIVTGVDRLVIHPNYNSKTEDNDFALVKLNRSVSFDSSTVVRPICLPIEDLTESEGKSVTVSGWGATSQGGQVSNVLQEVMIPLVSIGDCRRKYTPLKLTNNMFCAGKSGQDSCQGDSGGPVMFQQQGIFFDLMGVVSWGVGCALPGYPGELEKANSYVQSDSDRLLAFMASNRLVVNSNKTELMVISGDKKRNSLVTLNVGKNLIIEKKSMKLLGVEFQSNLKWDFQVAGLLSVLNQRMGLLKRLLSWIPRAQISSIIHGIIISQVAYALPIFGQLRLTSDDPTNTHMQKIQVYIN